MEMEMEIVGCFDVICHTAYSLSIQCMVLLMFT